MKVLLVLLLLSCAVPCFAAPTAKKARKADPPVVQMGPDQWTENDGGGTPNRVRAWLRHINLGWMTPWKG